jgi:hypothetical protein
MTAIGMEEDDATRENVFLELIYRALTWQHLCDAQTIPRGIVDTLFVHSVSMID